jgi:hypothetical protein
MQLKFLRKINLQINNLSETEYKPLIIKNKLCINNSFVTT